MKTLNPKKPTTKKNDLPVSLDISDWTPQDRMVKYRMPYKSQADETVQGSIIGFTIYPQNNWRAAVLVHHPTKFTAHGGTFVEASVQMGEEKGEYQLLFPNKYAQKFVAVKEPEEDDDGDSEEREADQAAPSPVDKDSSGVKGQRVTAARTSRLQKDFI